MATRSITIGARDLPKPALLSDTALEDRESSGAGGAISPAKAAKKFSDKLTFYEKKEIESFHEVYYVGQNCRNKVKAPTSGPNDGYDTDNGEYVIAEGDHIAYRYEIVDHLGSGAFGQVVKAFDYATGDNVAVKLIRNKKKVANQAKTEIRILEHINDKDPLGKYNVVQMLSNFTFRSHMCIVYELLGTNLYDHMEQTQFYPMALASVRKVAARMLVALTFLWKENIIHCDLKPENILYKTDASSDVVKVADLGSACYDSHCAYTYIQSRFYRAPEVILGLPYGRPIDLWSFGCILCELATGYPLFPGENEKDQLACIMEYLGKPPSNMILTAKKKRAYFEENLEPKITPNSKGRLRAAGTKTFSSFVGLDPDDEFISFLDQFLCWNPDDRTPPRQAMRHPWIEEEFVFAVPRPKIQDSVAHKEVNEVTSGGGARQTATRTMVPEPTIDKPVRELTDFKGIGATDILEASGGSSSPKRNRPAMLTFDVKNVDPGKSNGCETRDGLEDSNLTENARSLVAADHHSISVSVPPGVRQAKLSNSVNQSGVDGTVPATDAQLVVASSAALTKPGIHQTRVTVANGNAAMTSKNTGVPIWGGVPSASLSPKQRRTSLPQNTAPTAGVQPRGSITAVATPLSTLKGRAPNTFQPPPDQSRQQNHINYAAPAGQARENYNAVVNARTGEHSAFDAAESTNTIYNNGCSTGGEVASLVRRFGANIHDRANSGNRRFSAPAVEDRPAKAYAPRGDGARTASMANPIAVDDTNNRRRGSVALPPIMSNTSLVPVTAAAASRPSANSNNGSAASHGGISEGTSVPSTSPLSARRHEYTRQRHARRTRQSEIAEIPEPEAKSVSTHLPPM